MATKPKNKAEPTPEEVAAALEVIEAQTLMAIEEHLAQGYDGREIRAKLMQDHSVNDPVLGTKACPRPCFIHRRMNSRDANKTLERGLDSFRSCSTISKEQIIAMFLQCYRNALSQDNPTGASQILMSLSRLCGFTENTPAGVLNLINNIQQMPPDARRSTSQDYQIAHAARLMALHQAMTGKAGAAQAVIAATSVIAENFAEEDGPRPAEEAALVQRVRSRVVTGMHFPGGVLDPIERRDDKGVTVPAIDDFASLQTAATKKES